VNASEWRQCTLGDLVEIRHGYAFSGDYFGSSGTHIVLTPGNFFERGGFKDKGDSEKWYSGPVPAEYVLRKCDVIVAMTEQAEGLLGSSAIVPESDRYLHNQRLGLIRLRNVDAADLRFLYYLFNLQDVRNQIRASASGVKIRHTSPSRISEVRVNVPPIGAQRRIARILAAYDDLIDENMRRIQILDDMVRALYSEWFTAFRDSEGGAHTTREGLPAGWTLTRLGDLAEETRRNVSKGALKVEASYVGLEHIPRRSLALDAWENLSELGSNKLEFKKGEVLFGKIRPYFHKVSVAPFDGVCSADTIVIRATQPDGYGLVVATVSSDAFVQHATVTSNGSKMPRANWSVLREYPVAVPDRVLAKRFTDFVTNVVSLQQNLVFQCMNLRQTRDLLLPRLLCGQLSLAEIEGNPVLVVEAEAR
jgi:type I restriction enzyme S subunit